MQVEIQLRKLLQRYGLDKHGVTQAMADDVGVHRHTIGKLYRGQVTNPSLKVLGSVCGWLHRHGVPADMLPQALFGLRPAMLREAILQPGEITLFVGDRPGTPPEKALRWISQRDALVMAKVVQFLSNPQDVGEQLHAIRIKYVHFGFGWDRGVTKPEELEKAVRQAKGIFDRMQKNGPQSSCVLIGSQRVNHLVEFVIADTFRGCRAFHAPRSGAQGAPIYLKYREDDRALPSCFGGHKYPPGCKCKDGPGIYYIDKDEKWVSCPWKGKESDAGVVIVVREPSTTSLMLALFGFSGRGTEAVGEQLLRQPDSFWPLVQVKGKDAGIFICRVDDRTQSRAGAITVTPLHEDVLGKRLRA